MTEEPIRQHLAGTWRFALDPDDRGTGDRWWEQELPDTVVLPGSLQEQGFGSDITFETPWVGYHDPEWFKDPLYAPYQQPGAVRFPFWLQPKKHYVGAAWYQRTITVPEEWRGRRIVLEFERVHWESRVWLGGVEVGSCASLATPHVYDLTPWAVPGDHTLTVRIDNRMIVDVGQDAHSVTDHTQTNWNGIVGAMTLRAESPVWIDDVQVYPDVAKRSVTVRVTVGNATGKEGTCRLELTSTAYNTDCTHAAGPLDVTSRLESDSTVICVVFPLGEGAPLWDEFHPALHRLTVKLTAACGETTYTDERRVSFGLREFSTVGTQFAINGRLTFLRGTLECAVFPATGYPATDTATWRRICRVVKEHGLNHIRFHSWCPPEAAFVAADEAGVYLQVECGTWGYVGEGRSVDQWLYDEAYRILKAYGNHPSFVLITHGNEPYGDHEAFLRKWVEHFKAVDPRRLWTAGSAWPHVPENQFHIDYTPRIQGWGEELNSRINARPPETASDYRAWVKRTPVPIISHEIGQWCAYPDFTEIGKYRGVLQAKNFELFQASLRAHHMGDQAEDFLAASGRLQTLCYKEEIESALRTPGFGGFQLLGLTDFPGQGTALVGALNVFWEPKGYAASHEYRRFCGPTVLLARLPRRIFTYGDVLEADFEAAHFGAEPLQQAVLVWQLCDGNGKTLRQGRIPVGTLPIGNGIALGTLRLPLEGIPVPCRLRLVAGIEATAIENDWDVWVYPARVDLAVPRDVLVTDRFGPELTAHLAAGGRGLLLANPKDVDVVSRFGFSSMFWNTVWTKGQAPHTLGILCDPEHPALAHFPTDFHTNWQWWDVLHGAEAMVLETLPPELRPIVQPIDTWVRNLRLGLLFEARVGGGSLLVSSIDFKTDLEARPAARQLLYSLLRYVGGDGFAPRQTVGADDVRRLFRRNGHG